ncbi:SusC/RagA family TonB-linked outer membrane protein [Chitinophaga sp. GCM10012297]|uniref:SusC/RagA family TonB-linked outer membrane protein n=1 Tax=Chitinophaga chungangae TaxID=2821488 RepID=A0ABS3YK75_9BACT|nr:SusC/RagA family TonB-linked outer membrane protein [Chitinophaga chungangae]MBO9154840.1 SusC/RagA family TonB-linked outer membrane protein [Chitinophaga chungangae]
MKQHYLCQTWAKRAFLFLLVLTLKTQAASSSILDDTSSITLHVVNQPIENIFKLIEKQTGLTFYYGRSIIDGSVPASVNVTKASLTEVMGVLLKGKNVSWRVKDRGVVLSKGGAVPEKGVIEIAADSVPKINVSGVVMDVKGNPLSGATVTLKGLPRGQGADARGRFTFLGVPANATLVISSVGFETKQVKINGRTEIRVPLDSAITEIASVEVFSTGYQDIPKERATGSFVQLDNQILNRTVSTNILDRLINVTSSLKPEKGIKTNISIRGFSTINANMKPLVVVDGFPYDETTFEGAIVLNNLNPNDIESITVLRDAASASIWGARAGNGVIVIKTKKGSYNQKPTVRFNTNVNFIEKPDLSYLNLMSSKDEIELEKKRFEAGEFNAFDDIYPSIGYFAPTTAVVELLLAHRRGEISQVELDAQLNALSAHDVRDDLNKYLLQTEINQQYNVNVSGGSLKNNYYLSFGYDKNRGNIKRNDAGRYTLRFDNTFKPIDKTEIGAYIVYTQANGKSNGLDYSGFMPTGNTSLTPPYVRFADESGKPLPVPTIGTLRDAYLDTVSAPGLLDWYYRPLEELRNKNASSKQYSTRLGGHLRFSFIDWMSAEVRGQYEKRIGITSDLANLDMYGTRNLINNFVYQDATGATIYPVPLGAIYNTNNTEGRFWNIRTQLNINKGWERSRVNAILAYESSESATSSSSRTQYGYDPATGISTTNMDYNTIFTLRPSGYRGSSKIPLSDVERGFLNRFESFLGNAAYTFNDRYTITASGRIDKSNFLGAKSNQRMIPLWSTGISWMISDENFYRVSWASYLNLRITYGYNGNLNNKATSLPTARIHAPDNAYHNLPSAVISTPPNPGLTWEKIGTFNVGIDFRLLSNRVQGSLEYYKKKGINLIGAIPIDATTGVTFYTGNYANMKGSGIDLILNTVNVKKDLQWTSNFNLSYNTDKITHYDQSGITPASYLTGYDAPIIGKPIAKIFAFPFGGLDPETGDPTANVNGEKRSYTSFIEEFKTEELSYLGSTTPRVFGSLINTFSYKNVSLSCNITFKFNYVFTRTSVNYYNIYANFSGHGDYALRWQKPGDENSTTVPSLPATPDQARDNFYSLSDVLVEKGDHIRLQDIRLSYDLGQNITKKLSVLKSISIYAVANNLGIIWRANKYNLDPELTGYLLPPPKSVAAGLTVSF